MEYEFLKKLFGTTENGEPAALTYEQLKTAINADKDINIANLKEGGYVSIEKFKAKETELNGVKEQLTAANDQIKSFEGQDIEGVKKKVIEWEEKYKADTDVLKAQIEEQETAHQRDMYFSKVEFASNAAKIGVISEFDKQGFQLKDGVFIGADQWLEELKKNDPASFKQEKVEEKKEEEKPPLPTFATGTSNGSGLSDDQKQPFKFGFRHVRGDN